MKKLFVLLSLLPALCLANKPVSPWEQVKAPIGYIYRLSVPHGWLVQSWAGGATAASTIFVPDENHEWILESNT